MFDYGKFGRISNSTREKDEAVCIMGPADEETHFGIVRKSMVLETLKNSGVVNPSKEELDFGAATGVLLQAGISAKQAFERLKEGKHEVMWVPSAHDFLSSGISEPGWNVPCAVVVFLREW